MLNLELVGGVVDFDVSRQGSDGSVEGYMAVEVVCDGETVTFIQPDGDRFYCDQAQLAELVRFGPGRDPFDRLDLDLDPV